MKSAIIDDDTKSEPPEISTADAVAEMERISRQLEAALNPANVKVSEDQKARMWSHIYDAAPTVNRGNDG